MKVLLFRRRSGPGACGVLLSGGRSGRPVPRACSQTRGAWATNLLPLRDWPCRNRNRAVTPWSTPLSRVYLFAVRLSLFALGETAAPQQRDFGCGQSPRQALCVSAVKFIVQISQVVFDLGGGGFVECCRAEVLRASGTM